MPCSDPGGPAYASAYAEKTKEKLDVVTEYLCFMMRWVYKKGLIQNIDHPKLISWYRNHRTADEKRVLAKVKKILDADDFEVVMSLGKGE